MTYDDRLMLPVDQCYRLVKLRAVERIMAAGDYSEVHLVDATRVLMARSLREWQQELPETNFVRVHRSAIVNLDCIERLETWFNSSFRIHLKNGGAPIVTSRRYAALLRARFR
jgi:two-component system LytT family response regulator